MATVLLLIADFICEIFDKKEFFSTSIKCGTNPSCIIGATVVEKVNVGVIISEPFLKLKDDKARRLADEPELTIKPNLLPNKIEIFFSNSLTDGPSINERDLFFKTSVTADISSLL
tara:strand:- start:129 stop:476 length:348 start_codon:yes stop_codon:yes gene_type:complete